MNFFDFLPKSVAPAAIAYLILCYMLGEVFAGRIADHIHVPTCIAGQHAKAARANYGVQCQKADGPRASARGLQRRTRST